MLSLTTSILSAYSVAISSRIGATWRQGPHHSAQKSTRTGLSDLSTCDSKSASVTAARFATGSSFLFAAYAAALGGHRSEHHGADGCSASARGGCRVSVDVTPGW